MADSFVTVVGAGLAGAECAFQLSGLGIPRVVGEMKPHRRSPAHRTDGPAELVCSNSFRSDNPQSAIGLLHAELRDLGSLILASADQHRVPAGDALAVDREKFSEAVGSALQACPGLLLSPGEVGRLPDGRGGFPSGPLPPPPLTGSLRRFY